MHRIFVGMAGLLLAATPAQAVVTAPRPLKQLLTVATYVCTAKVEKLDADRPAMILTVEGDLKGKMPIRRLPVNLTGDSEGTKHTPLLLKRLAKDLPLVLIVIKSSTNYSVLGYTNGTWFQFNGKKDKEGARVRWAFLHAEPYLRQTYKGSTAEFAR